MKMEVEGVQHWLDMAMDGENVVGATMINSATGLYLGARGAATESDATFLIVAARHGLDENHMGAVAYKDLKVLLSQLNPEILIAVFKEKKALEATNGV